MLDLCIPCQLYKAGLSPCVRGPSQSQSQPNTQAESNAPDLTTTATIHPSIAKKTFEL